MPVRGQEGILTLQCQIQPRASRDEFAGLHGGRLKIRITAPPVDGEANQHLVRFLAKAFGVPQKQVRIVRGEQGRAKTVCIEHPTRIPAGITVAGPAGAV